MENGTRTLSGINVLAGIWLIIAPFILNYNASGNVWQEVVFGIIVAVLGLARLAAPAVTWPSWINFLIGIWLIIAPWVIAATTVSARWNEVITGIIVAVMAYASGAQSMRHHIGEGKVTHAH